MVALILLKGQPGSGKSTIGRAMAQHYRCPVIDKDDARNAFSSSFQQHPTINWNELSYDVMQNYVDTQLGLGLSVIVDCPLARLEVYQRFGPLADKYKTSKVLIECEPSDEDIWRARLEARGNEDFGTHRAHKPGSWEDLQVVMRRNNGSEKWSDDVTFVCRIKLDTTSGGVDDYLQTIINEFSRCGVVIS